MANRQSKFAFNLGTFGAHITNFTDSLYLEEKAAWNRGFEKRKFELKASQGITQKEKIEPLRDLSIKEQKDLPKSGTYVYDVAFAEWDGISFGEKMTVVIKDSYVKVIYEGDGNLTGTKPKQIMDQGYLRKHKSGVWIIVNSEAELISDEIGGCTGGPSEIDFLNNKFWMC